MRFDAEQTIAFAWDKQAHVTTRGRGHCVAQALLEPDRRVNPVAEALLKSWQAVHRSLRDPAGSPGHRRRVMKVVCGLGLQSGLDIVGERDAFTFSVRRSRLRVVLDHAAF
jgi:hypothetical protein